jgi:hypothetical protein
MELSDSINKVWDRVMKPRPAEPHRVTKESLNRLNADPKFHEMVERMQAMVETSEGKKATESTAWPLGQKPEDVEPL